MNKNIAKVNIINKKTTEIVLNQDLNPCKLIEKETLQHKADKDQEKKTKKIKIRSKRKTKNIKSRTNVIDLDPIKFSLL